MVWKVITTVFVVIGVISFSIYDYSHPASTHAPNPDSQTIHEQIADLAWIFFLCLFSLAIRFRKSRKLKYEFLAIAVFLFVLAAVHSHSLWSFSPVKPSPAKAANLEFTRIHTVHAATLETGLQMRDVIHAMAFDGYGDLWLTSASSGPYVYSVQTNEVEDLIRPDTVYGLLPDPRGIWVLSSSGAVLYSGLNVIDEVQFPHDVIPLCGARSNDGLYFGTSRGLYLLRSQKLTEVPIGFKTRITNIYVSKNVLLLTTDEGAYRYGNGHVASLNMPEINLIGLLPARTGFIGATDSRGLVQGDAPSWRMLMFGSSNLNFYSPEAVCVHRNQPYFGSLDGSIVTLRNANWVRGVVSDWPVTSLASNGESLYAWSNGELLQVEF